MKRKEFFWMLLPCLLLLGAGVYFTRSDNEPFAVEVESAQQEPLTPLDVAEGWDTRVRVVTNIKGVPAKDRGQQKTEFSLDFAYHVETKNGKIYHPYDADAEWRKEMRKQTAKGGRIYIYPTIDHEKKNPQHIQIHSTTYLDSSAMRGQSKGLQRVQVFHVNTKIIPAHERPLTLHIEAKGERLKGVLAYDASSGQEQWSQTAKDRFVLPIRVPLKSLRNSPLNKASPLEFVSARYQETTSGPPPSGTLEVRLRLLEPVHLGETDRLFIQNPTKILDEQKSGIYSYAMSSGRFNRGDEITLSFPNLAVYGNDVVFKADVSINECWPLPISVVLRKDGKNLDPPLLRTQP
jgi:hypothetical protein